MPWPVVSRHSDSRYLRKRKPARANYGIWIEMRRGIVQLSLRWKVGSGALVIPPFPRSPVLWNAVGSSGGFQLRLSAGLRSGGPL